MVRISKPFCHLNTLPLISRGQDYLEVLERLACDELILYGG
jgi:hypothetical protein